MHNTVGDGQFSSLLDDFAREVVRLQPSLVVVGGLRMMLSVDSEQGTLLCVYLTASRILRPCYSQM